MLCQTWKSESELIKITNKMILISSLGFFTIVMINAIWDLKMLHLYDVCMHMESENKTLSVIGILLFIFRIVMMILTIFVDIDCLFRVRSYKSRPKQDRHNISQERSIMNETPMRSSILNFGLMVYTIIVAPIGHVCH